VIFDTDIFIWIQRGNVKAAGLVDATQERFLSIQSYMELLQGAENRQQQGFVRSYLKEFGFSTLPLTENIGHRAAVYIEQFGISHGLRTGDAIIAATAAETNLPLCTSNAKHFKAITEITLKVFKP